MSEATETDLAPSVEQGPSGERPPPFPLRWWMPIVLLFPSLFLRIVNIGSARNFIDDANLHVLTALAYTRSGLLGPDSWWSPPLKHLLTAADIALFGNDEIGWRLKGALFGALAVYLVFLVSRRAFRHTLPAFAAAILLMLDPYSISMSHTTHEDLPVVCFILLGILFFLRWADDRNEWESLAAGLFFGAAVGLRWYAAVAAGVVVLCIVWMQRKELGRALATAATLSSTLVATYLAAYLPWLARGYSLAEWASLQFDALRVQGGRYQLSDHLLSYAGAQRWFISWVGGREAATGNPAHLTALTNDPVIWFFFIPSALLLCYVAAKRRRIEWFALSATLLVTYAFFLASPRPIIIYSAMGVVSLGCVCAGFAIAYLFKRSGWLVLCVAGAWSLLLFPAVGGVYLPPLLNQLLLRTVLR